ncbi:NADH:flavin oxidoreductase [Clostridium sp. 19966]|uniref:NADH:flavin oxidoreductase n=1 Tax=Clostridium sp. 19966 TaxID=2768166 RepID=UPI0028E0226D|nr:NADH:flavin oxidoreductase [Clostridium sp. 19966]MDT8715706.1 NADH:flavin oxidoreductase [Clostridium sp. 19966]
MAYLKQALETNKLNLKNRLVMPPMATAKAESDGRVSESVLDYYDEKSKGGYIGLIIIEHSFITKQGKASNNQLSIAEDSLVEKLKALSELIHKNGSKAVMQINHAGSAASSEVTGLEVVGPSAVQHLWKKNQSQLPRELTREEIKNIVEEFKAAALRVKKAGFDGVEIHSAHGYLLSQFLSPLSNKRTDEYGGDIDGRSRIHIEVIKAVREAVGEDFPILLRLGASDYTEGGLTLEDSKLAVKEFEKAGVDILDISGGFCGYNVPGEHKYGTFTEDAYEIKKLVSIPVIVAGGVTTPELAEEIISSGKADLLGVARAILKDSNWAKNAMEILK